MLYRFLYNPKSFKKCKSEYLFFSNTVVVELKPIIPAVMNIFDHVYIAFILLIVFFKLIAEAMVKMWIIHLKLSKQAERPKCETVSVKGMSKTNQNISIN